MFELPKTLIFRICNPNLHSCIQVRTWLQELLNMALLQGGFDTGFQMHDIIRQYCISRCSNPSIVNI